MTRLPPGIPGHWSETDGGGASDLQTDVMRFMAILAFCLVAIFALVQAIPAETPPAPAEPVQAPGAVTPDPASPPQPAARAIPPAPASPAAPARPVEPRPADLPRPAAPEPAPDLPAFDPPPATPAVSAMPPPPAADPGFTLRFESDEALRALVARQEVGLYAMQAGQARRLQLDNGRLEFWQASMPSRFHEMDAGTVPGDVVSALARSGHGDRAVQWGVTLPAGLARDIETRLAAGTGGDLVISARGALRQE